MPNLLDTEQLEQMMDRVKQYVDMRLDGTEPKFSNLSVNRGGTGATTAAQARANLGMPDVGPQGPVGPIGLQGPKGDTGSTGAQGIQGIKGDTGATGLVGATGAAGPAGPKGDTGNTGSIGPQGPKGADGAPGVKGDKGDNGSPGTPGLPGKDGTNGTNGAPGIKGDQGIQGPVGPKGDTGPMPLITNVLTSTSTTSALSAAQGKILNDSKANLSGAYFTGPITAQTLMVNDAARYTCIYLNPYHTTGCSIISDFESRSTVIRTHTHPTNVDVYHDVWMDKIAMYPAYKGHVKSLDLGKSGSGWNDIYTFNSPIIISDSKEKKDIKPLVKIKNFFMSLAPVSYQLKKGTSNRRHFGLIAQDIEEAIVSNGLTDLDFAGFIKSPNEKNDGEYIYGLRYEEFIPMLIKMAQDQDKEIQELKDKVKMMETTNEDILSRLAKLEKN